MTTSGTSTFNLEFDEIIEEAYERCGLESRTGYDLRTARRSLNLLFMDWANRGLNLWTIEQRSLALVAGDPEYDLPADTVNILSAVVRTGTGTNQQDITLDRISQNEYLHVPDKFTKSRPSQYYLQRTATPVLFIYPAPDTSRPTPSSTTLCAGFKMSGALRTHRMLFFALSLLWWQGLHTI